MISEINKSVIFNIIPYFSQVIEKNIIDLYFFKTALEHFPNRLTAQKSTLSQPFFKLLKNKYK